jgi:hypothetical protein
MSYKVNPLSVLGRIGYGVHLLAYPTLLGVYVFGVQPYMEKRNKTADEQEWKGMPKAKKVDPDLFNPFTPIPYHNNPELKYAFANVRMFNYINENQINPQTYAYKNYHNSYDHDSKYTHLYNWTSIHSPKDDNKAYHGAGGHGHH